MREVSDTGKDEISARNGFIHAIFAINRHKKRLQNRVCRRDKKAFIALKWN